MKKRILVAAASLILAALILLLLPVPSDDPGVTTGPTVPTQTTQGTKPTVTTPPTDSQPTQPGVVRVYSCETRFVTVLTELAAEYFALTGVEVVVLSPEEGDCQTSLQRYMESEDPPTAFCIHSQSQLGFWQDSLLDLNDTDLAAALCNDDLGLWLDGKLLAIPTSVEGYGLLANLEVLGTVLTRSDIYDFASLSMWVKILKDNSITAFPHASPSLQDAWQLLIGDDLESTRSFLDLYLAYDSKSGNALELFAQGKTAFCLTGTWDHDTLESFTNKQLDLRNLDILPTYSEGAMQYVCNSAWCVNAGARQVDIDATLVFLNWMVSADENGTPPVDRLQVLTPFAASTWYGNWLEKKLHHYMETERVVLQWKGGDDSDKRMLLALTAYMENNTDENWDILCRTVNNVKAENGYTETNTR